MFECRTFITVKEIGEVLGVSESKSYGIVRDLNKELAENPCGYLQFYFLEKMLYPIITQLYDDNVHKNDLYFNKV